MTASTCSAVTEFDTAIAIYSGDCDALTCVAGNDDAPGCDFWEFASTLRWTSIPGTVYYITVGTYPEALPGPFELTVTGGGYGAEPIPTLSEWGAIAAALLILIAGTLAVMRQQRAAVLSHRVPGS